MSRFILLALVISLSLQEVQEMPWNYVISWKSSDRITTEQTYQNADMIRAYLEPLGWDIAVISAICGFMYYESAGLNPGQWQYGFGGMRKSDLQGLGLPQFTPWSKWEYTANANGFNYYDGAKQIEWIGLNKPFYNGSTQWTNSVAYESWKQWTVSYSSYEEFYTNGKQRTIEQLCYDWSAHYERVLSAEIRRTIEVSRIPKAREFLEYFTGQPVPPTPPTPPTPTGGSSGDWKTYLRPKRQVQFGRLIIRI